MRNLSSVTIWEAVSLIPAKFLGSGMEHFLNSLKVVGG